MAAQWEAAEAELGAEAEAGSEAEIPWGGEAELGADDEAELHGEHELGTEAEHGTEAAASYEEMDLDAIEAELNGDTASASADTADSAADTADSAVDLDVLSAEMAAQQNELAALEAQLNGDVVSADTVHSAADSAADSAVGGTVDLDALSAEMAAQQNELAALEAQLDGKLEAELNGDAASPDTADSAADTVADGAVDLDALSAEMAAEQNYLAALEAQLDDNTASADRSGSAVDLDTLSVEMAAQQDDLAALAAQLDTEEVTRHGSKRGPEEMEMELDDERPTKRSNTWQHIDAATGEPIISRFTCVKRSAVRDGYDQTVSQRTGFVEVGTLVDALECRTNDNGVVRVRFSGGWVSCTSQKGDELLLPVGLPRVAPAAPTGQGCRCCGKIGHLRSKCPLKDKKCSICGKVRSRFCLHSAAPPLCLLVLVLNVRSSCACGHRLGTSARCAPIGVTHRSHPPRPVAVAVAVAPAPGPAPEPAAAAAAAAILSMRRSTRKSQPRRNSTLRWMTTSRSRSSSSNPRQWVRVHTAVRTVISSHQKRRL